MRNRPSDATGLDEARFGDEPALVARRESFVRRTEILAARLILAYLEDDPAERGLLVLTVARDARLPPERWELAIVTAATAAEFWRRANPELGRKLLTERLEQLTRVPAA